MGRSVVRTLALAVVLATVPAVPDATATPAEHRLVPRMSAVYEVTADGVLHATETIDFAFGEQTWRVSAVTASTPAGANLEVRLREFDPQNQAEEMGRSAAPSTGSGTSTNCGGRS